MATEVTQMAHPNLTATAQAKALRAIEDVHLAYHSKGGINDMAERLKSRVQSAGQVVYGLAVFASRHTKTVEEAADYFREMCEFAENEYKQQHGVDNIREVLPSWATYKSTILRGVTKFELDPVDYRSERQFRIAIEAQKPKDGRARRGRDGPNEVLPLEAIGEFLEERTAVRGSLQGLVSTLVLQAEAIARGNTPAAAEVLKEATKALEPLVDPAKLN